MAFIREDEPFLKIWRCASDDPDDERCAYATEIAKVTATNLATACGSAVGSHLAVYESQERTVPHALYLLEVFARAMNNTYIKEITDQADKAAGEAV